MYAMATMGSGRKVRPASAIGSLMGKLVMILTLTRCHRRKPREEVNGIPFPLPPMIKGIRECFSQPCCLPVPIPNRANVQKLPFDGSPETDDQWNVRLGGKMAKKALQCQHLENSIDTNCLEFLTKRCRPGCKCKWRKETNRDASCCLGREETEDRDTPKWVSPKCAVAIPFPISAAIQGAEAIVNQPCCLPSP